jgi:hypothetical protein
MAKSIEDIGGRFHVSAMRPRGLLLRATLPLDALQRRKR